MALFESLAHILLVEDDEIDIQNIRRAFKKHNVVHPLHIARNGVEALDKLYGRNNEQKLEPQPKIILLDINMPKMNGIEFLTHLRQDPVLHPAMVFILTTSNEERDKMAAYDLNVAGYLLKPVQCSDFMDVIYVLNQYWALMEFPK